MAAPFSGEDIPKITEGLAIRTKLVDWVTEAPSYICDRIMPLRVSLVKAEHVTILCCYAPTPASEEDAKNQFYAILDRT